MRRFPGFLARRLRPRLAGPIGPLRLPPVPLLRCLPPVAAALALGALPGVASAQDVQADLARLSIGIAPFERVAPPGLAPADLAPELAGEILALGAGRTVAPATLADEGRAEPSAERVRELAREHDLDALVVGRITRLGQRVSLDVRLRDGRTGAVAGTYVAELALGDAPQPVLARLATQLVSGAMALEHVSPVPVAAAAPDPSDPSPRPEPSGAPAPSPEAAPEGAVAGGAAAAPSKAADVGRRLGALDPDQPFSIRSDALEATERDGRRTLVFRDDVVARQGDLELRAARLVADYPEGARQPSRLRAEGGVRVSQGEREARCLRAEYTSRDQKIVCRGDARLRDGADELRGDSIVFDLAAERVTVEGGTRVALAPGAATGDGDAQTAALGELPGDGPVEIQARQLEASQDASGARRIRLEGSVEVAREDLVLRARRIEALYPPEAREPERLVATGDVVVLQSEREARCDRAVYHRSERRVHCAGSASLREGEDRVTGEEIEFDLEAERLVVSGGTRLVLAPRGRGSAPEAAEDREVATP